MDNELLKRGAKSCGFDLHWHSDGKLDINQKQLEQLAFFLIVAEREACAKVAEVALRHYTGAVTGVAEAIRARSNKK